MQRLIEQRGFTLVELLVAMSIMALVGYVAVPHISAMTSGFDAVNAQSYVLHDLKRAQAQTVLEGCRGILEIDPSGRSYTFGCDYLPYDTNNPPQHDVMIFQRNLPGTVSISTTGPIIFNSRGQAVDSDDVINNVTVTLREGGVDVVATGVLLGTGVFAYE